MNRDILFYSNKCPHSNKLITMITNHNLNNRFNFVCIENVPRSNIPKFITKVPTIVVNGKQPFIGASSFNYINALLLTWQNTNSYESINKVDIYANQNTNPLLISAKNPNIKINNGPNGLSFTEISKISDDYAFVKDDDDFKESNKRLQYLDSKEGIIDYLPKEKRKINKKEQDERLRMILNKRDMELKNYYQ